MIIDIGVWRMMGVTPSSGNGRKPVDLIEIHRYELFPEAITACLEDDKPILGWLCTRYDNDHFWLYMKEDKNLLCKYYAVPINGGRSWLLYLTCTMPLKLENISRLFESDFYYFSHVYLDDDGYFIDSVFLERDIDYPEMRRRLQGLSSYFIPEETSVVRVMERSLKMAVPEGSEGKDKA